MFSVLINWNKIVRILLPYIIGFIQNLELVKSVFLSQVSLDIIKVRFITLSKQTETICSNIVRA